MTWGKDYPQAAAWPVAYPVLSILESILKWVAHPAFRWRGGDSRCQARQGRHI